MERQEGIAGWIEVRAQRCKIQKIETVVIAPHAICGGAEKKSAAVPIGESTAVPDRANIVIHGPIH
jgi:hypothetical protein